MIERAPRQALRLTYDLGGHTVELLEAQKEPGEKDHDASQLIWQGYFNVAERDGDEEMDASFRGVSVVVLTHGADHVNFDRVLSHLGRSR